jgi:hypothetical protein
MASNRGPPLARAGQGGGGRPACPAPPPLPACSTPSLHLTPAPSPIPHPSHPQEPYYWPWTNHARAALYAAPAFVSAMGVLLLWPEGPANPLWARPLTRAALAAAPAAALLAGAASYVRLRLATERPVRAFRCVVGGRGASQLASPVRSSLRFL